MARMPIASFRSHVECPECGKRSETTRTLRKPGDEGAPAIWDDVRSPYFSDNLGKVVGSKREIREEHKRLERDGFVPLTKADRKLSVENAWKRSAQAKRDIAEVQQMQNSGELEICRGDTPMGEVVG